MGDGPTQGQLPGIISNAREEHAGATSTASTIIRSLSLGAIAAVWLFAGSATATASEIAESIGNHPTLAWALVMGALAALLDVAQYLVASVLWGSYASTWGRVWLTRLDTKYRPLKWRMSSLFDIDEYLIEAAHSPAETATRNEMLKWAAHARKKEASRAIARYDDNGRIKSYLDEPVAPRWISAAISSLFIVKGLAITISYAALLAYFIPLLIP